MIHTHSFESWHIRQIEVAEKVRESSLRALATLAMKDQLRLFDPEPAQIIPFPMSEVNNLSAS